MIDVKYFIAHMVGAEACALSDSRTTAEEGAILIKEMKRKTGLELFQILNCIQSCVMGRLN